MKILYIANERRAAELAGHALRGIAPSCTLAWARTLAAGQRWVQDNRDAAVVIVEAEVQGQGCTSFVQYVRGLGLATPIVIVAPEHLGAPLAALNAGADDFVVDGPSFEADLSRSVTSALQRTRGAREEATSRAELEERLAREEATRTQHTASLTLATRICTALQQRLFELEAALRDADERRASEAAAAAEHLAQRHTEFTASLTQAAEWRDAIAHELSVALAALDEERQTRTTEAAAAAEHLARREAELGAALTKAVAARTAVEHTLAETAAAQQHAQERATSDLSAGAEREAELVEQLLQECTNRRTLEHDLVESRVKAAHARRRFLDVASALRRRSREHKARLEAQLTRERADSERLLRASDKELMRVSAEYDQVRQSLDQVQAAFHTLEHVASEHANERARLESVVADRDTQLSAQAARHHAAERAAEDALAEIRERLRLSLEGSSRDIVRLQREGNALRQELEATRAQAETLRGDVERVPVLEKALKESQHENHRQFERAPYGLCKCTQDGTITHVNHSLVRLLGYRKADELRRMDFAATVFECAGDLRWLIERSVSRGTTESVETTLKTRDRRRLSVRLHALTIADGSVEIAVEDVTSLRAVEERLRQAQRMEAVGRLASEVAVTCDTLLRDVSDGGQQWLAAIGSDTPLRHQGELLLGEVTRAASFLRQFAVYGNEQLNALEPASVQQVLRDLAPVLQRVVGEDIELVLPKTSGPADVDVEAERVERVLVNVASYARERMPHGGRVKIDLATTMVDRKFIATYPNVRPGAHVLITVSEVRAAGRAGWPIGLRAERAVADESRSASNKPGVDLGALMGLIGNCGGHLWMAAEPSGNMTLKIYLPKRADDDVRNPAASAARSNRARPLARWFRH
jgi:hypothetical protein